MNANVGRAWVVALLALAAVAQAQERPRSVGPGWIPIEPEVLGDIRGGHAIPFGLQLAFGIERVAFVNGELVSSVRAHIPDVANMTAEQAQSLSQLNQTQLVQLGTGNVFQSAGNAGLVIQNSLDGQHIRAQTTLDISVNTLGMFQAINAAEALRNANVNVPGAP